MVMLHCTAAHLALPLGSQLLLLPLKLRLKEPGTQDCHCALAVGGLQDSGRQPAFQLQSAALRNPTGHVSPEQLLTRIAGSTHKGRPEGFREQLAATHHNSIGHVVAQ